MIWPVGVVRSAKSGQSWVCMCDRMRLCEMRGREMLISVREVVCDWAC